MKQAILVAKVRRYQAMWLLRKTKELKNAGEFNATIEIAAVRVLISASDHDQLRATKA